MWWHPSAFRSLLALFGGLPCWALGLVCWAPCVLWASVDCAYVMLGHLCVRNWLLHFDMSVAVILVSIATFILWILFLLQQTVLNSVEMFTTIFSKQWFLSCHSINVMWQYFLSRVGAVGSPLFHGMPWNFVFEPPTPPSSLGLRVRVGLPSLSLSVGMPTSFNTPRSFSCTNGTVWLLSPSKAIRIPPNE